MFYINILLWGIETFVGIKKVHLWALSALVIFTGCEVIEDKESYPDINVRVVNAVSLMHTIRILFCLSWNWRIESAELVG